MNYIWTGLYLAELYLYTHTYTRTYTRIIYYNDGPSLVRVRQSTQTFPNDSNIGYDFNKNTSAQTDIL